MSDAGRQYRYLERTPMAVRGPIAFGFVVIALFFGGILGWAATAPLQSAAIAPGVVSVETSRKTVQHLEGGIVGEIAVQEGDRVRAGQVLIRMDDTKSQAQIQLLRSQIEAADQQLALLQEEIVAVERLLQKGLTQKPRLLALLRRKAELEGRRKEDEAQLRTAQDVLSRAEIRAPMDGTIVGLQVHTPGGVISPGEALLSIVPRDEPLMIQARVSPLDIDVVQAGMPARVRLTPYDRRSNVPIEGKVLSVSADSMVEERTGQTYYLARIVLTQEPAEVLPGAALYPGMPVEAMIVTGEHTALDYLLQPVRRSFNRAFREN